MNWMWVNFVEKVFVMQCLRVEEVDRGAIGLDIVLPGKVVSGIHSFTNVQGILPGPIAVIWSLPFLILTLG